MEKRNSRAASMTQSRNLYVWLDETAGKIGDEFCGDGEGKPNEWCIQDMPRFSTASEIESRRYQRSSEGGADGPSMIIRQGLKGMSRPKSKISKYDHR